jgi:acyl carrier protein
MDDAQRKLELTERIAGIACAQLGRAGIAAHDRFMEDLGAESFDVLNIVAAVEDRFGIFLEEEEILSIRDVTDLCCRVLEKLDRERAAD